MKQMTLLLWAIVASTCMLCAAGQASCPAFWTKFGGNCYRHFGPHKTWTAAEAHCVTFGAHLTSVHGEAENNFLYDYWRSSVVEPVWGFFIGFNDRATEGIFIWTDGTPADYTGWADSQPNNYGGTQDCSRMWYRNAESDTAKDWDDQGCETASSYICKKVAWGCSGGA